MSALACSALLPDILPDVSGVQKAAALRCVRNRFGFICLPKRRHLHSPDVLPAPRPVHLADIHPAVLLGHAPASLFFCVVSAQWARDTQQLAVTAQCVFGASRTCRTIRRCAMAQHGSPALFSRPTPASWLFRPLPGRSSFTISSTARCGEIFQERRPRLLQGFLCHPHRGCANECHRWGLLCTCRACLSEGASCDCVQQASA